MEHLHFVRSAYAKQQSTISRERCRSCGGLSHWACVSRWTILRLATRRFPICNRFLSTRSRSTSHLSLGEGKRPIVGYRAGGHQFGARVAVASGCRRRGNKRSSSCRTRRATRFKVTLLDAPSQSASTPKWMETAPGGARSPRGGAVICARKNRRGEHKGLSRLARRLRLIGRAGIRGGSRRRYPGSGIK